MKNGREINKAFLLSTYVVLAVGFIFLAILFVTVMKQNSQNAKAPETTDALTATEKPTEEPTLPPATEEPLTWKDYNLLSVGDAMLYNSMMKYAKDVGENGEYDFTDLTKYLKSVVEKADIAVFNMEAAMLGDGDYTQYPQFNVPDSFATSLKNIGFDVSLFSNNHTYDRGHAGLIKTQQTLEREGFTVLGTRKSTDEKSYKTVSTGDLKIGMLNYGYDSDNRSDGAKRLNGSVIDKEDYALIDTFNTSLMSDFYGEVKDRIAELEKDGADLIVFYIHWGDEYENTQNSEQTEIANKLCELGVDVLIGSHPHVVQPVDYIEAENGNKMLVYYSLGNFTSLQNRVTLPKRAPYTEYELASVVTIRKYSNGETVLLNASYEPLYQHRISQYRHQIVPLRYALENEEAYEAYGLNQTTNGLKYAKEALLYIDGLVGPGIKKANEKLGAVLIE